MGVAQHPAEPGEHHAPPQGRIHRVHVLRRPIADQRQAGGGARERDNPDGGQRPAPAQARGEPGHRHRPHNSPEDPSRRGGGRERGEVGAREPRRGDLEGAHEHDRGAGAHEEPPAEQERRAGRERHEERPAPHHHAPGGHDPPDAQPVHEDTRRDHQTGVGVEVGCGEQTNDGAGRAEGLHELLGEHPGRGAVEEGEEKEEGGDAPHEPRPRAGTTWARHAGSLGPESWQLSVSRAGSRGRSTARQAAGPPRLGRAAAGGSARRGRGCGPRGRRASARGGYGPSSLWVPARAQSSAVRRSSSSAVVAWAARMASRAGSIGRAAYPRRSRYTSSSNAGSNGRVLGEEAPEAHRPRQLGVLQMVDDVPHAPGLRARPPVELVGREPVERRQERPVARAVPRDQLGPLTILRAARRRHGQRGRAAQPVRLLRIWLAWTWACSA